MGPPNPTQATTSATSLSPSFSIELPSPESQGKPPEQIKLEPLSPAPMVCWYDPGQLMQTAIRTVVSTLFGQNADRRLMEALTFQEISIFDYTRTEAGALRDQITVDYVADTGDGWNSTYSVAYWLSQPGLNLPGSDGREHRVSRADVLVFGGDEVYPTPSREDYRRKLVAAFETARAYSDAPCPHVYAVPGNHDWYDSLVGFTRLFISREFFGGWYAPQTRSYFALRLPHGWWLIGTDVQLGSDIDKPQLDYFRAVASRMEPGDRVILCTAEPHWVYEMDDNPGGAPRENNVTFLERDVFKDRIGIYLAGDLHHYRRHQAGDRHKITAGGGGAFLHPTHVGREVTLRDGFTLQQPTFPDQRTSARLAWRNLLFPLRNPKFGLLTGLLYFLTGRAVLESGAHGLKGVALAALSSGITVLWIVVILGGFLLFTDTPSRTYRLVMGTLHGGAHILGALALSSLAAGWLVSSGLALNSLGFLLLSVPLVMAGGYLLGPILMGIYLLISINVFGRHRTEAFSSLAIQDWKNFVRMQIGADGRLTIFPVGIRRVARRWKPVNQGNPRVARMDPDDPRATNPELIGGYPVEVPAPVRGAAGAGAAAAARP